MYTVTLLTGQLIVFANTSPLLLLNIYKNARTQQKVQRVINYLTMYAFSVNCVLTLAFAKLH